MHPVYVNIVDSESTVQRNMIKDAAKVYLRFLAFFADFGVRGVLGEVEPSPSPSLEITLPAPVQ